MLKARRTSTFVHPQALCESKRIGRGTRVWAFAHVLSGARIGRDCNVCDHVFIENDVTVGDGVTIKSGVQLWDGLRVGNRVFIGPNATFTNDRFPRSRRRPKKFLQTILEDDVSIGANATILPGLRIGRGAMVGAGAVVTRNVPPGATVVGNPAALLNSGAEKESRAAALVRLASAIGSRRRLKVPGCWVERLPNFADARGSLTPLELQKELPFKPQRVFLVYRVPGAHIRGEHAHRRCRQLLVAVHGGVSITLDNGRRRQEIRLEDPTLGLYVPPLIWTVQHSFNADSVLLAIASHTYDPADYIRDYAVFKKTITKR